MPKNSPQKQTAIIIGAGPAGLTAAYELLTRTNIHPIIIEKENRAGGISSQVKYKGNLFDFGIHRFFTKSARVEKWWTDLFPLKNNSSQEKHVFIKIKRKSEIYFRKKLFDYPPKLDTRFINNLGLLECMFIGISYLKTRLIPHKVKTLEDFYINSFGYRLYNYFFKSYTYKLWGIPCDKLSADWGVQRVKGVSLWLIFTDILKKLLTSNRKNNSNNIETSLIEKYIYPKYGSGDFWQYVADTLEKKGVKIYYNSELKNIKVRNKKVVKVLVSTSKKQQIFSPNYLFSSIPIRDLIKSIDGRLSPEVKKIANNLYYRNMIFVRVAVPKNKVLVNNDFLANQWVYLHQTDVLTIRLQVHNSLSKIMLKNPEKDVWLSLEYYCNDGDDLWIKSDKELLELAKKELEDLSICYSKDIKDHTINRLRNAYPIYIKGYYKLIKIQNYINSIKNLYAIGRNGTHRYNNMDHSMLSAMSAVDSITDSNIPKSSIWLVNAEKEYHEEKTS
jgi:protoporphyrinogen oxidase